MIKRLDYIDALRGLAMILVVFVHVEGFCFFNLSYISYLGSIISLIHLPLFFFISGIVAYKLSPPTMLSVRRKAFTLLVPMTLWGLIYTYIYLNKDVFVFIQDTAKMGYWFTLVLFEMYLIYYGVKIIVNKYTPKYNTKWVQVLVIVSIFMYLGKYPMRMIEVLDNTGNILSLHYTMNYFQFFVLGLLLVHFKECVGTLFNNYFNSIFVSSVFILIFLILSYYKYYIWDPGYNNIGGIEKIVSMLMGTFCSYLAVLFLYFKFQQNQQYFSNNNKFTKFLKIIGCRTLDIYLIHYFILGISSFPSFSVFLKDNIVVEFIVISVLTCIVICFSLLISLIIRKNNVFSKMLLGISRK